MTNREITEDEAIAILEYSSMCPSLRGLRLVPYKRTFNVIKAKNDLLLLYELINYSLQLKQKRRL